MGQNRGDRTHPNGAICEQPGKLEYQACNKLAMCVDTPVDVYDVGIPVYYARYI